MKIRIIGHAGSGKTTLSQDLGNEYGFKVITLDGFLKIKNKSRRQQQLYRYMNRYRTWVVEGVHEQRWCRRTFTEADLVILLDYPLRIVQYRVIKRTFQGFPKTDWQRKKFLIKRMFSLLKWNRRFTKSVPKLKERVRRYNSNLFIIRSPKELDRIHTIIGFYDD